MKKLLLALMVAVVFASVGWCQSGFTQKDRELLIELKTRGQEMDKRFMEFRQAIDKRFVELREDINKRFEQVDKRFVELRQDTSNRFEQMMNTIWILATIFAAITIGTIGFAIWDRRTMIRPFETKVAEIDKQIAHNQGINETLLEALKEFAATNRRFGEILKRFNLF